jgi:hypothetical protein
MELLLSQIEKGLDAKLYYLSLFIALCIPDICSALESEDGQTASKQYKAWINQYLVNARPEKYADRLSADHIWQFRCSLLHQGSTKHDDGEYKRILFFEPGAVTGIKAHCCIVGSETEDKSLLIDLQQFCTDIIAGAKTWLAINRENKNYINNYERLIKRHPRGISPIFGCPVIG